MDLSLCHTLGVTMEEEGLDFCLVPLTHSGHQYFLSSCCKRLFYRCRTKTTNK